MNTVKPGDSLKKVKSDSVNSSTVIIKRENLKTIGEEIKAQRSQQYSKN